MQAGLEDTDHVVEAVVDQAVAEVDDEAELQVRGAGGDRLSRTHGHANQVSRLIELLELNSRVAAVGDNGEAKSTSVYDVGWAER